MNSSAAKTTARPQGAKASPTPEPRSATAARVVLLVLAVVTIWLYWPVREFQFTNYDDPDYVSANPFIQEGITARGIAWAFTSAHSYNWHPATWLSHMLDIELFGMNPGAHHLVSVALHLANTLLLCWIFWKLTRGLWQSAFVAAVFAWHPLHVESVAWICERKDVLSTFFWLLTLWAYARFVDLKTQNSKLKSRWYAAALIFFALGLMSKPMLVTLPFVLLLLDFWPMRRFVNFKSQIPNLKLNPSKGESASSSSGGNSPSAIFSWKAWRGLVFEKLPLFALSAASCAVTFLVQRGQGAVADMRTFALGERLTNALVSYARYIGKTLWPNDLVVFYPYPESWPFAAVTGAAILLISVTTAVLWRLPSQPHWAVGWFWFLGTLVPVIGLVQVGLQSMADRYTYVSMMGLTIMVAWGIPELFKGLKDWKKTALGIAAIAALVACVALTRAQLPHWRNGVTLFEHAVRVTPRNGVPNLMLANAANEAGQPDKAEHYYRETLRISPNFSEAHYNLGNLLVGKQRLEEAIGHYEQALRLKPDSANVHANLSVALSMAGRPEEALAHSQNALQLQPGEPSVLKNLSIDLIALGRFEEAITHLSQAQALMPHDPSVLVLLGDAHRGLGRLSDAAASYARALHLNPNDPEAREKLSALKSASGGTP